MNSVWQDVLFGLRMLAKKPLFTAVAALSLALGIGLNTAIFTLINTILWGSLPYREPDRIIAMSTAPPQHPDQTNGASVPDFMEWKARSRSFEALGAMSNSSHDFGAEQNGTPAERIEGEELSPELLRGLDVKPLMGRVFTEAEDEIDHPAPVILLTYRLWQRRFGGDQNILSRTILVDGVKTNVIGVMRPDYIFLDDHSEFIVPILINRFQLRGSARYLGVAGRLKDGVSMRQAQAEMDSIAQALAREFPRDMDHGKPWTIRVQTIREGLFGWMSRPLLLLQGAVAFVLLIGCANVAALQLARASSRRTEVAIRAALGAGRGRIVRQFLTESLMLSLVGGAVGIVLAWWGVRVLVAMAPSWFPRLHEINIDRRVLFFTLALSVLTGVVFGLVPALQGSKSNFGDSLKEATRGGSAGGARNRLRGMLVTAQLALALILLVGSGLLIRSFLRMQADLGCDPSGLLTFMVRMPQTRMGKIMGSYRNVPLWEISPAAGATLEQIFERVQGVPGVQSAAATFVPPLTGSQSFTFSIDGQMTPEADLPSAIYSPVTPNFFRTMKIAVLRGRDFTDHDTSSAQWVAIINETMGRRFFPNEDPIGKRLKLDFSPDDQVREIIAVVHDFPDDLTRKKQEPAIFVPYFQGPAHLMGAGVAQTRFIMTFVVRTLGDPLSLVPAMQKAVAEIDPNRPLTNVKTEEQQVALMLQYPRYYSMLLGLFAAVATALAAVGIYGIMAYAVEQRTREIGIRMALGAAGWDVLTLLIRQAVWLIAGGVILGLAGSFALTRFISSELWEVQSIDPAVFGGVSTLLMGVALLACLVPTRRAVRVDPTVALRCE
jgi:putative ABC transport system permease protein